MFTNVCLGSTSMYLVTILTTYLLRLTNAQSYDYPSANLSTLWNNSESVNHSAHFADGSIVRAILVRETYDSTYACGFYCNGINCATYLFGVFIVQTDSDGFVLPSLGFPQLVWSANRNKPVQINSTLKLTSQGDLVLKDADGTIAWNTNTNGKNVIGLNLTEIGNLVLFDEKNATVWQSFDHPTDSLVPGQKLRVGQKLVANVSTANSSESLTTFTLSNGGLFARIESNPPQTYWQYLFDAANATDDSIYVEYLNGSIALFLNDVRSKDVIEIPQSSSTQFIKLGSDDHLKAYEWKIPMWEEAADIWKDSLRVCEYPQVCGEYGICSNGQCSCPDSSNGTRYFEQINERQPDLGCSKVTPLSCEDSKNQGFLELVNVTYFYLNSNPRTVDSQTCKEACANNCSCKAAIFHLALSSSIGYCYMLSQVFSLMNIDNTVTHHRSTTYIKVQESIPSVPSTTNSKTNSRLIILGATFGSVVPLILLLGALVFYIYKKQRNEEAEEVYLDQIPGMPTRFSYTEMKIATKDFTMKLGEGGFGAVFKGNLADGLEVAVKCLDGMGQIKKSFLAEVEAIGSIHHVSLVRLVGFCAEKSHRLLVYEYMPNGSLDKWIFNKINEFSLDWEQRKKIIFDVAKGLNYLHEDCRQKIIHLDIKPQNILLDESFNAKVSDFGLSKLIDRDQSRVITTMRGTPGYLAPEWLSSAITEKVDVYSFGVVILEVVCGRKIFDCSQKEEDMYLLSLFQRKAGAGELLDMIDRTNEDMHLHGAEVVSTMKVAAWCLQGNFAERPSMSTVVKVLDETMEAEDGLTYDFSRLPLRNTPRIVGDKDIEFGASTPLLPSVLSGPR